MNAAADDEDVEGGLIESIEVPGAHPEVIL